VKISHKIGVNCMRIIVQKLELVSATASKPSIQLLQWLHRTLLMFNLCEKRRIIIVQLPVDVNHRYTWSRPWRCDERTAKSALDVLRPHVKKKRFYVNTNITTAEYVKMSNVNVKIERETNQDRSEKSSLRESILWRFNRINATKA